MKFSRLDKLVSLALLDRPLAEKKLFEKVREDSKQEFSDKELKDSVNRLEKLKLVEKTNGEMKLSELIKEEIARWREIEEKDSFRLRVHAFIEIKAVEEKLLAKELDRMLEALKKEEDFNVYSAKKARIVQEDQMHSSFIETTLTLRDFKALIKLVLFYAPSSIEIIKPSKITFDSFELQEGLMDLTEFIQKTAHATLQLMNKQELDRFYSKFYQKKP